MGRRRTRVSKIRDIIRYRMTTELSERQIARALDVSRTVVARTLQAYGTSGLVWDEVPSMADSVLEERLTLSKPAIPGERYAELAARFPEMVVELKKKGMTMQLLWERYLNEHPGGYQ